MLHECVWFSLLFPQKTRTQRNGIHNYISVCVRYSSTGIHFDLIDSGSFMHTQVKRVRMEIYRRFFFCFPIFHITHCHSGPVPQFLSLSPGLFPICSLFVLSVNSSIFSHTYAYIMKFQRNYWHALLIPFWSLIWAFYCFYDVIEWRDNGVHGTSNNRLSSFLYAINTSISYWHMCTLRTVHVRTLLWNFKTFKLIWYKIRTCVDGLFYDIWSCINGVPHLFSTPIVKNTRMCHTSVIWIFFREKKNKK